MHFKMSSAQWRLFRLGPNVFIAKNGYKHWFMIHDSQPHTILGQICGEVHEG